MHGICTEARTHLQTPVESFAAEDPGIGRALEFRKTVEALWSWPFRQPVEIAIGSSDVAVRARRNIDDGLALAALVTTEFRVQSAGSYRRD